MQEQFRKEIETLENDYLKNKQQSLSLLKERELMLIRINALNKDRNDLQAANQALSDRVEMLQELLEQKTREVEGLAIQNTQKERLCEKVQRQLKDSWQENKRLKYELNQEFETAYLHAHGHQRGQEQGHEQDSALQKSRTMKFQNKEVNFLTGKTKKECMKKIDKIKMERSFHQLKSQRECKMRTTNKKSQSKKRQAGKILKILKLK